MAAGYQELFLEQGTDFSTSITLDDVYGEPFVLEGFIGKSQMKKSYYSSTVVAEFDVNINDPLGGVISLQLNSNATANVAPGRYVYDVIIKDTSGANTVTRVLEGIVNVLPQVTIF
jgi:hypothetical protein